LPIVCHEETDSSSNDQQEASAVRAHARCDISRNTSGRFQLPAPRLRLTPRWSDSSGPASSQLVAARLAQGATQASPVLPPVRSTTLISSAGLVHRQSLQLIHDPRALLH